MAVILMSVSLILSNAGAVNANTSHPVRMWGDISSTYRTWAYEGGDSYASEWLNISSFNASSYVVEPWIALINGGIVYSVDETNSNDQESVEDQYINGKIQLDIFPTSRFPFTAYANKSRNELDDIRYFSDVTNTRLGLTQLYRSEDGRQNLRGNFERNIRDDVASSYISDNFILSASNQLSDQVLHGDIQYGKVVDDVQDNKAISYSITGRQSYNKSSNLTIENLVSSSVVDNEFASTISETEASQLSSLLSWRPDNRKDVRVTGSVRISDLELQTQQQDVNVNNNEINVQENAILNINQGVIYNYSSHILISESINGSYNRSDEGTRFTGIESGGITYIPDVVYSSIGDYSWSVGSNVNNLHGDVENEQTLNNRLGHSLSQNTILGTGYSFQSDINQSLNYENRSANENTLTLDHSLSMSLNKSSNNNQSVIRFFVSDVRREDEEKINYQLINLQISGDFRLDRDSHFIGNLTLQKSFHEDDQSRSETTVMNGQLDYVRNRLFQALRLNYRSVLKFRKQESESDTLISQLTNSDPESDVEWSNSLNYKIGRLDTRLKLDFVKTDNKYDRLIMVQINRSFGDL